MKDKYLGHMVVIRHNKKSPDPFDGDRGEVVCKVRTGRVTQYIVQFDDDWSHFRSRKLRINE